jgi:hypothetical protein
MMTTLTKTVCLLFQSVALLYGGELQIY